MPSILIQDVTPRNQYTATMGQTIFVYSFTLFDETDIEVYKRTSASTPADDYNQKLQLNVDYTVDLVGSTITLTVACSGGEIVTLVRNMPDERLNLYTNGTVITADALNTDQESSVLLIQQNSMYDTVLAPHYNKSEIVDDANPLGGDVILPRLTANQVWVKDPTNNFITTAPFASGGGGGGVVPANPGVTGNPNSIAIWSNIGILGDSNVLMTSGNITNLNSISFQDIRIATVDSHTINSVNGKDLSLAADTGHNLNLASSGQQVTLSGLKYPTADGTAGYFITTDGAGNLSWAAGGGGAPFASTKYNLVQFSNTTGGLQDSGIDYQGGVLSGPSQVDAGNLSISGNTLASTNANGNLNYTPNGTGVNVFTNNLEIKAGAALQFYRTSNAFYTALKAGSPGANVTWTLPDADGTNGEVLTTDGAGTLLWSAGGSGGGGGGNWVQVGTATAVNSATVDLAGVFTSTYKYYMIIARNVTLQTTTADLTYRIGTGVTPTWKSGGSDYSYAYDGYTSAAADLQAGSTGASAIVLATNVSASTTLPTSFILRVFDPANAAYKTPFIGEVTASNDGTTLAQQSHSGAYLTAEAVSSIRFLASAGNIVTGVFEVYGFNPAGGGGGGSIPTNVIQNVYMNATGANVTFSGDFPAGNSVTITPSSSVNRVKLTLNVPGSISSPAQTRQYLLKRNGVLLPFSVGYVSLGGGASGCASSYIDSPATTSAITYSLFLGDLSAGTPVSLIIAPKGMITFIAEEVGP